MNENAVVHPAEAEAMVVGYMLPESAAGISPRSNTKGNPSRFAVEVIAESPQHLRGLDAMHAYAFAKVLLSSCLLHSSHVAR